MYHNLLIFNENRNHSVHLIELYKLIFTIIDNHSPATMGSNLPDCYGKMKLANGKPLCLSDPAETIPRPA
jgi:hypothetical protein